MDKLFDDGWGARTQGALTDYIRIVRRYERASQQPELDTEDLSKLESEVQEARDHFQFHRGWTNGFTAIFHTLARVNTQELRDALRRYQSYLDELPTDFIDPPFVQHRIEYSVKEKEAGYFEPPKFRTEYHKTDPPIGQQREFLQAAITELKAALATRGEDQTDIGSVTAKIRQQAELEARLRQQCDEDVQKYPDQEDVIRRGYRRAIDALREQ